MSGSTILIYFYPEQGVSIKSRMVYSTCKASLAEQLKSFGLSNVRRLDARSLDDLSPSNLKESNENFKPSQKILTTVNNNTDKPEDKNSNPRSRFTNKNIGSSFRMLTGGIGGGNLPKGVVLPPPGAYG